MVLGLKFWLDCGVCGIKKKKKKKRKNKKKEKEKGERIPHPSHSGRELHSSVRAVFRLMLRSWIICAVLPQ